MRRWILTTAAGLAAACFAAWGFGAEPDTSRLRPFGPEMDAFHKPLRDAKMLVDGFLWLDAEDFG